MGRSRRPRGRTGRPERLRLRPTQRGRAHRHPLRLQAKPETPARPHGPAPVRDPRRTVHRQRLGRGPAQRLLPRAARHVRHRNPHAHDERRPRAARVRRGENRRAAHVDGPLQGPGRRAHGRHVPFPRRCGRFRGGRRGRQDGARGRHPRHAPPGALVCPGTGGATPRAARRTVHAGGLDRPARGSAHRSGHRPGRIAPADRRAARSASRKRASITTARCRPSN